MKILMEKPITVANPQNNSQSSPSNDLFELLSACLFSNVMNNANAEESEANISDLELNEKSDNESDVPLSGSSESIDSIQKMIADMLQLTAAYQAPKNQSEAESKQTTPVKDQANPMQTKPDATNKIMNKADALVNTEVTEEDKINLTASSLNKFMIKPKDASNSDHSDDHPDEKLTAAPKKLTPADMKVDLSDKSHAMNNLLSNTSAVDQHASKMQTISGEHQERILRKSIEGWTTSVNQSSENIQVIAPQGQVREFSQELNGLVNKRPEDTLLSKATDPSVKLQLDHIEQSPAEPGMFHVRIKVNPPELGPIHANIKMNNNNVEVQILTSNAHANHVVKAHLSALANQFSESSMNLNTIVVTQQANSNLNQDQQSGQYTPDYIDEQIQQVRQPAKQGTDSNEKKSDKLVDAYI